jgi:nucleoid DNA-binding protein
MKDNIYGIGDLSREISRRSDIPIKTVHRVLQIAILVIKDLLYHQCVISLVHFCTFSTKIFNARMINLPKGQRFFSPRRLAPVFKYKPTFKKQIREIKLEDTYVMTEEIEKEIYLGE